MSAIVCKHGEPEIEAPDWCVDDGGLFLLTNAGSMVPLDEWEVTPCLICGASITPFGNGHDEGCAAA